MRVMVTQRDLPLPVGALHQAADGSLRFRTRGDGASLTAAEQALRDLFGDVTLKVERLPDDVVGSGKAIQFSSDTASEAEGRVRALTTIHLPLD